MFVEIIFCRAIEIYISERFFEKLRNITKKLLKLNLYDNVTVVCTLTLTVSLPNLTEWNFDRGQIFPVTLKFLLIFAHF